MKKLNYILLSSILVLSSCSYFEYDNYDDPDAGIEGVVVDKKTNEPLSTEAANSYKVDYYELSWEEAGHATTQSQFFWGKADGTFRNTKLFAGKYRITLKEGAFHSPEPEIITLGKKQTIKMNFSIVPFARVKIDEITLDGDKQNNLVIKYTVEDTESEVDTEGMNEDLYLLSEAQIFISSKSPNVGITNTDTKYTINAKKDLSNYEPGIPKTYTERNVKGLLPGRYWIRVGARTENPQKRYNFTPVQEIVIPTI